ncbi:RNA polymerase-binding protein DksA [Candidatus Saccharibacteria bacterium]|nr:RNA polymerase-binding protein DksA [Candidatus Saccharibacteria bacterium]NIS15374.1 RNA polymerase-binding protein DksA [candidate division Zixibacteria bacterium]NIV03466.1 RNA polymerase-binding protein DksA [Calditrichia bacterium]NIS38017.1 RNA polymerase-binding protein DksA [Candidatus Saccharibacteria bacterium]NIV71686.1 RNA polymerase-binding protein DksA [Calditrichia bacterium]
MNKKNLQYFRRKLTAQLQDYLAGSDCNLDDLKAPDEHLADPVDQAAYTTERNFSHHLCSRNNRVIREIEQALQDIENGDYGICDRCNEDIPIKRLKVRPMARYCISCKGELEKKQILTGS